MRRLRFELTRPTRADLALVENLKTELKISRNQIKAWFKDKKVLLHGRPIPAAFELSIGKAELEVPVFTEPSPLHPSLIADVQVVFEDSQLLVLNKPTGLPSIPLKSNSNPSAVQHALALCPELGLLSDAGVVHRLDTATSGLLTFAKTPELWTQLRAQWKTGAIKKTYRALCRPKNPGTPAPKLPYLMDRKLGHAAKSKKRMIALPSQSQIRGEPLIALTQLTAIRTIQPDFFDFEIQITTGVMHQIRCHLEAAGFPIQGDPVYGGCPSSRLWLHAWQLKIELTGRPKLSFQAELPARWPEIPNPS